MMFYLSYITFTQVLHSWTFQPVQDEGRTQGVLFIFPAKSVYLFSFPGELDECDDHEVAVVLEDVAAVVEDLL